MTSKQEQRKYCTDKRRSLTSEERETLSKNICEAVSGLSVYKNAGLILSYMASCDEADPKYIKDDSKVFAYPVSLDGGIMKAYLPCPENGFEEGKYGIISPRVDTAKLVNPDDIDLVIVPCVGFDENKGRLGHGKGYYDRYLPLCKNAKFVCIAFEAQKLDKVFTDANDVTMDFIVTDKNIY